MVNLCSESFPFLETFVETKNTESLKYLDAPAEDIYHVFQSKFILKKCILTISRVPPCRIPP